MQEIVHDRDIRAEHDKLTAGQQSEFSNPETFQRAVLRLRKEIAAILGGASDKSTLLSAARCEATDRSVSNDHHAGLIRRERTLSTFTRHILCVPTNEVLTIRAGAARSSDPKRCMPGSSRRASEAASDLQECGWRNKAGCLDHCALGPSVVIYPEGVVWYSVTKRTPMYDKEIMERHVMKGEVVTRLLMPDHPAPSELPPLLNPA